VPHSAEEGVLKIYEVDSNILRVSDLTIAAFEFDADNFHDGIHYLAAFFVAHLEKE
jgi:hypothetical protein